MKKALIALVAGFCLSALADNLVTQDGTVYLNVTIVSSNPEQMLIVHDGGGCQVRFEDLAPNSLTPTQRKTVESGLQEYAAREERREQLRLEREAFELAQKEKGLIEFEGNWMSPADREAILVTREQQRLETERLRVQLAKEQAEFQKEKIQTEQARRALEEDYNRSRWITTTYSSPYYGCGCGCKKYPCQHTRKGSCSSSKSGISASWSSGSRSISISSGSGCSSSYSSSTITRGPFNRYGSSEMNSGPFNR